jgi:hypothetical protein
MEAEDLVLDDSGKGQVVEQLSELFPHVGVAVLPQAFVVEAVPVIKDKVNNLASNCYTLGQ